MTSFIFDDYVRATMGGASNVSDGKPLSSDQIRQVADYLKAPGSGPDATSSYETFVSSRMSAHPPVLPPGYDYVGYSGYDSARVSNFDNATEYVKQLGGGAKAGLIGDTRPSAGPGQREPGGCFDSRGEAGRFEEDRYAGLE